MIITTCLSRTPLVIVSIAETKCPIGQHKLHPHEKRKKIHIEIGNYIQGYKLAHGKKVNNLPPLTTSKPIFLAPAGGGCHNPSF